MLKISKNIFVLINLFWFFYNFAAYSMENQKESVPTRLIYDLERQTINVDFENEKSRQKFEWINQKLRGKKAVISLKVKNINSKNIEAFLQLCEYVVSLDLTDNKLNVNDAYAIANSKYLINLKSL